MGCSKFKKTKTFLGLILLLSLILIISSNQIQIKAKNSQDFNLKAKGYCGFNYLEWEPVPGADRYWIYRGIGEGKQESMPLTDFPVAETYYKDSKNVIQGTKYCYIVKAVDKNAKEFAKSNEACAIPTCSTETKEEECRLVLQFQIGNTFYWVNGAKKGPMLTAPVLRWDRTFLIIRHVVEEVGGTISWDGTTQTVTILTKEGKKIEFQIGNRMYRVNGVSKQIDPYNPNVVPFILNGRTLIPLRVTGNELNAKEVNWYGDKQIAELVFIVPCPEKPKAKIDVLLPENCVNGTYIEIYDPKGNPITLMREHKGGLYTTDCTLLCPGTYIVKPVNPNCKFYPETQQVVFNEKECCPQSKRVEFKCECIFVKYGRIIVKMPPECTKETKVNIFDSSGNIVWSGSVNNQGVFDTDCKLNCPSEYKVVPTNPNFVFNPTSYSVILKDCCPGVQIVEFNCVPVTNFIQKLCGCILRMTTQPDSNGNYQVYVIPNCQQAQTTPLIVILNFPAYLPDTNLGISILDYYNTFPQPIPSGLGCIWVVYEPTTGKVIEWAAQPDKKPCCGEIQVGGRIIVKMAKECIIGTKILIYDETGNVAWSGEAGPDGVFDTGCKLKCPGIYKIVPVNEKCKFDPVSHVVKLDCCPSETVVEFRCECVIESKGRIVVIFPKECIEGTIVHVYETQNYTEVFTGKPDGNGVFDTGCTLACPGIYVIRPENKNCLFDPKEIKIIVEKCCPEYYQERFSCKCDKPMGRINAIFPKDCIEGTIVHIIDSQKNVEVFTGKVDPNGNFDTGCVLDCPGIYIIKPENKNCTFIPSETKIEIRECCPKIYSYQFGCRCEKPMGRIQVKIPKECINGTVLYIYDSGGKLVGSYNPNSEGWFDTGCSLTCPGTYTLKPQNQNCRFSPETIKVDLTKCCPDIQSYEFKCECTYKGRIDVKLPLNCLPAKVEIYDSKGNLLYRLSDYNANGVFTTGCNLPCPGTYTIKPVGGFGCTFRPETKTINLVQCCPVGYGYVEFECSCIQMGRIVVTITGNCPDTKVEIYNMNNVKLATLTRPAGQPNFDSYCTIPCNQTVRVVPVNPKCKFDATYKDVYVKCCPDITNVEFRCSCSITNTNQNNILLFFKNILFSILRIFY
ncbi:MAG: copper amine oxidase N-terminal domain-containing protein [Caldisericia bacterium]|nr:copper amine oxidase N-terminal domain-containing protein [Caldisericia bacterium]